MAHYFRMGVTEGPSGAVTFKLSTEEQGKASHVKTVEGEYSR